MQKSDRTDEPEESQRSRPSSRRSSVSLPPRKNSLKKDKRSPLHTPPSSSHSTPKKTVRPCLDFLVTGKQILKRADRANSLPGSCRRQPSDSHRAKRVTERINEPQAITRESEDELSLDLSQVSDFEASKLPLATSTPKPSPSETSPKALGEAGNMKASEVGDKIANDENHKSMREAEDQVTKGQSHKAVSEVSQMPVSEVSHKSALSRPGQKPRSASLQHIQQRVERRTATQQSMDLSSRSQRADVSTKASQDSTFSEYSRDSLNKTSSSASQYRYGTDYSSVSPEYSQSSTEVSPRNEPSPVLSSWADRTAVESGAGEWSSFWANYNSPRAPLSYDQCPTPYRPEEMDNTDFEWSGRSRARSPDSMKHISSVIRSEGLRLTPRDTQNIIRCAHLLGSVLSRAIDRRARDHVPTTLPPDIDTKKKTLTLNLKETVVEKKSETVTTQTDISLPNTKSAPRIFESILRQLSKSSIDEPDEKIEEVGPQIKE